ncbi:MAG: rhomboid family intramembrane serine protease [Oscillospiraceae bacterium]|nr:rhomboid family intramembrane serine protease [Oscillospiraceae bacterium]
MKKHAVTIQYNAPATLTFALLSLLTLVLATLTHGWTTDHLFSVYRSPLDDLLTYPRMVLHVLGHRDLAACTANIVMILVVGPAAEERFGSAKVLLAILLTAIATSLVMWFLFPASTLMGASGIVFMLIVLSAFSGARDGVIPLTLLLVLALYLGSEVVQAVTGTRDLAQLTQITGGVVGVLLGAIYARS